MIPSNQEIYTNQLIAPSVCIEYNTGNINITSSPLKNSLIAGTLFLALTLSQSGTNNITNLNEIASKSLKKNNFSLVFNNVEESKQQMLGKNKKNVPFLNDDAYSYTIGKELFSQYPNNKSANEISDLSKLAYNNSIINFSSQQKELGEVKGMAVQKQNIYKNVNVIEQKKILLVNSEMSEYDYYVKIPKGNVRILQCNLIKNETNNFSVNWEV